MPYDALCERLSTPPDVSVAAFPDGSVDTRYTVRHGEEVVATRRRFGERIAAGDFDSFRLEGREVGVGGQAPNAATQAAALGADVALAGHLDHEVLDRLPFPTHSMGDPASVTVFELDDGDVMFAEESADIEGWTLDDLLGVAPDGFFARDAVFAANWVSFPAMTDALERLDGRLDCSTLCLDPGNCAGHDPAALEALLDALAALDTETVLSANRPEVRALADAADAGGAAAGSAADDAGRMRALARATGGAAVLHAETEAVAATPDTLVRVPNLDVETPVRQAGAGDRFGGGLAVARAAGWNWETALACANVCASRYVATGETGDREGLRSFLDTSGVA